MGLVSPVPLRNRNRTKSSSMEGKVMERFWPEELEGLEKSSKDMIEPCAGSVVKRCAEEPVERFERAKKERKGSKDPNSTVNLSATPLDLILRLSCWRTTDANVWPAIEGIVPKVFGELSSNCCCEAKLYSWLRSSEEMGLLRLWLYWYKAYS